MAEKRSDVEIVRDQLTREVTNDAFVIASDIFRRPEPDVMRVSNQQIDDRYRRAFAEEDRAYLISEAHRDPKQFLEATNRLGVVMPAGRPVQTELPLPKLAQPRVQMPVPPTSAIPMLTPAPPAPSVPVLPTPSAPVLPAPAPSQAPPPQPGY